jgi:hypothetical protein
MKDCPVCGAKNDDACLQASEYFPTTRNAKGEVVNGERREHGLYFKRKPHLARLR